MTKCHYPFRWSALEEVFSSAAKRGEESKRTGDPFGIDKASQRLHEFSRGGGTPAPIRNEELNRRFFADGRGDGD